MMKLERCQVSRSVSRTGQQSCGRSWSNLVLVCVVAVATVLSSIANFALAQTYPNKPIRFVVGFPAGSTTDAVARVLAEQVRNKLGQPTIVENRAGANGVLGVSEAARSPADGYTVLVTNSSSITVNPQVYKKISYSPERDFTALALVVSAPFILTVNPSNERTAGVNSLADMIALAKSKPGQLTYGTGGVGNLAHLGFELINNKVGIKTTHVPYKSSNLAQLGLLSKEIDLQLDTPTVIPLLKTGKIKALAVTGPRRWPDLPDVPTMAELGYPAFEITFWLGALVPAQTPPTIIQTLSDAIKGVREDAIAMKQLQNQGSVDLIGPQDFAARIRSETSAWGEVIRREKIELD
jgi:tripartite-type tricarboxylate transporter receptor subunit TctC